MMVVISGSRRAMPALLELRRLDLPIATAEIELVGLARKDAIDQPKMDYSAAAVPRSRVS